MALDAARSLGREDRTMHSVAVEMVCRTTDRGFLRCASREISEALSCSAELVCRTVSKILRVGLYLRRDPGRQDHYWFQDEVGRKLALGASPRMNASVLVESDEPALSLPEPSTMVSAMASHEECASVQPRVSMPSGSLQGFSLWRDVHREICLPQVLVSLSQVLDPRPRGQELLLRFSDQLAARYEVHPRDVMVRTCKIFAEEKHDPKVLAEGPLLPFLPPLLPRYEPRVHQAMRQLRERNLGDLRSQTLEAQRHVHVPRALGAKQILESLGPGPASLSLTSTTTPTQAGSLPFSHHHAVNQ